MSNCCFQWHGQPAEQRKGWTQGGQQKYAALKEDHLKQLEELQESHRRQLFDVEEKFKNSIAEEREMNEES